MAYDILFLSISEFREYYPADIASDLATIKPFINQAEIKYIKPILGADQYNNLLEAVNETPQALTDEQSVLLHHVLKPLSYLTYMLAIPHINVNVSDAGVRQYHDDQYKPAFQPAVDDLKDSTKRLAYEALDELLEFLDENIGDYPLWSASSAYDDSRRFFINTAKQFSEVYSIRSSRLTYLLLQPVMKKVEELVIEPELSTDYFDELKADILADTVGAADQTVLDMLLPAIAHLTIARAYPELQLEITDSGVIVHSYFGQGENAKQKNPAARDLVAQNMAIAERDGQAYLGKLKKYLDANASASAYSTYFESDAYTEPDDDDDPRVYENDEDAKIYLT